MGSARVLMYHSVAPSAQNLWYVTPSELRSHIGILRDLNQRIGGLSALLDGADQTAVLTFDDAFVNVYEHAFPLLNSLGLTGTIFVPVNFVGGMNTYDCVHDWDPPAPERIMSWAQLAELHAHGWSIQSHGCSHIPLNRMRRAHVEDEIKRSRLTIEDRLGCEVFAFAYAYGVLPDTSVTGELAGLFQEAGYSMALLAEGDIAATPPPEPYQVKRTMILGGGEDSDFRQMIAAGINAAM